MTLSGWLIIDKPEGVSSAGAVTQVKKALSAVTGEKVKVGHTGALDPAASGVLPLALGEASKLCRFLLDSEKEYEFDIKWGAFTDTDDAEGRVTATVEKIPAKSDIESALTAFRGKILQTPPKFSAIKIAGKRAYRMARDAAEFEMPSREVNIYDYRLTEIYPGAARFYVKCSKGTYIRALARDLAVALSAAGHVSRLRRVKAGKFTLADTILPDKPPEILYKSVLPSERALDGIPALALNTEGYAHVREGRKIFLSEPPPSEEEAFPLFFNGYAVGIGEMRGRLLKPVRLIHNPLCRG